MAMTKLDALTILESIGAKVNQDFHSLSTSQVNLLLGFADKHKYRAPKNANGSRGRMFYQFISRVARRPIEKELY